MLVAHWSWWRRGVNIQELILELTRSNKKWPCTGYLMLWSKTLNKSHTTVSSSKSHNSKQHLTCKTPCYISKQGVLYMDSTMTGRSIPDSGPPRLPDMAGKMEQMDRTAILKPIKAEQKHPAGITFCSERTNHARSIWDPRRARCEDLKLFISVRGIWGIDA